MDAKEYIVETLRHPSAENHRRTLAGIAGRTCEGCGACCGRVLPMTIRERARLLDYVRRHGIKPTSGTGNMCSLLDAETRRCRAYPARPFICRAWDRPGTERLVGTNPGQPCGMRADKAPAFWAHAGEYRDTDTWELFGIEDGPDTLQEARYAESGLIAHGIRLRGKRPRENHAERHSNDNRGMRMAA